MDQMQRQPEVDDYPALPWRKRLMVIALTLLMVWVMVTQIAGHPGGGDYVAPPPPPPAPCGAGQSSDCVGGVTSVTPVIAAPPAARAGTDAAAR